MEAMVERLFPLAALITPNIPEAERLAGTAVADRAGMTRAALALRGSWAPPPCWSRADTWRAR